MDMRRMQMLLIAATIAGGVNAEVPEGYYAPLQGKSGDQLMAAVSALASGHNVLTYNSSTWPAFERTDVRKIKGEDAWWDMYSNNLVYVAEGHDELNIEHSVANSWWGGKSGSIEAYSDLYLLNPSDQNANIKKSHWPPGTVATADILDNDVLRIGKPAEGIGDGAANVFEPADEYKGDFARAYFYTFTAYRALEWKSDAKSGFLYTASAGNCVLKPWAVKLLMDWHRQDPVDSKELERQEVVAELQGNRNPFIDHPELAEYIWGDKNGEAYTAGATATATERPAAPEFEGARMAGVNTYTLYIDGPSSLQVNYGGERLMVSRDGGDWHVSAGDLQFDEDSEHGATHTYLAYTSTGAGDNELRSGISRLTTITLLPGADDLSEALWHPATTLKYDTYYLILAENGRHVLSADGGRTGKTFLESAGRPDKDGYGRVTAPYGAALVKFEQTPEGDLLGLYSMSGDFKGWWNSTALKQMKLDKETGTPGKATLKENSILDFSWGDLGTLHFNASQPRFLNYKTQNNRTQLWPLLYEIAPSTEGISLPEQEEEEWICVKGNDIICKDGSPVYDLSGRALKGTSLQPGIYIAKGKKILISNR